MESNPNYDIQTGGTPAPGNVSQGEAGAIVAPASLGLPLGSSIGISQSQEVKDSLDITIPTIIPPSFSDRLFLSLTASSNISQQVDLEMNKICCNMLTQWNDAIKKQIAETKAYESTPQYIAQEERKRALVGALSAVSANVDLQSSAILPVVTLGLVFASGGGTSEAMMIDAISKYVPGVNPSADVNVPQTPLIPDMRQELGLIGAAFLQGLLTRAQLETLVNNVGGGTKEQSDAQTAKNFAQGVISLINSGGLQALVSAIVISNVEKGEAAAKYIDKLTQKLSILLLASALAALYTSAKEGGTGHITGEEFEGLLDGTNETFGPNQAQMDQVLAQLNAHLDNLSPGEKSAMMAALLQFVNTNPPLKTLTNPNAMIQSMVALQQKRQTEGRI